MNLLPMKVVTRIVASMVRGRVVVQTSKAARTAAAASQK